MRVTCLLGLILVASVKATSAFAANVEYSGPDVIGVSSLIVDGQSYDATFFDGNYNSFLAAYPEPDNGTNYTAEFAEAATNALFDFVVVENGFAGIGANTISGCTSPSCFLSTTVEHNPLLAWTFEFQGSNPVYQTPIYLTFHQDTVTNYPNATNVLWTPTSLVPLPAAVWLLASALGVIGWARRTR